MSGERPVLHDGFRVGLFLLAAVLILFTAFRLALFFKYRVSFAGLGAGETLLAFVDGVRFDLSITALVVGAPLCMLLLPVSRRWWISAWAVTAAVLGVVCATILAADFIYFGESGRHMAEELRACWGDPEFVATAALQYWPALLAVAAAFVAVPWAILRLVRRRFEQVPTLPRRVALTALVAFPLLVQAHRGVIKGKPLGPIDAYSRGSAAYGNLVLNGVFSSVHSSRRAKSVVREGASEGAVAAATSAVLCPWEEPPVQGFPLQRRVRAPVRRESTNRWNVIVIVLEHFGAEYVDACSHRGYGVSPNLDGLASNAMFFTRCYANGQRSIHGWASVLLSTPPVSGLPYLGAGLEVSGVHRIGATLARNGYRTVAAQTGPRRSYRVDAIAAALGFERYAGKADLPRRQKVEPGRPLPPFGWDYDGLMYVLDAADAAPGPFFVFMIGGTPHEPFCVPDASFEKYPHTRRGQNGLLNALFYSDWAIGAFMAEARKRPWFGNTVFVITADHGVEIPGRTDLDTRFGVPLFLLVPGAEARVVDRVASQVDIWPTVVDLLGLPDEYSGIGRSLVRDAQYPFALLDEGSSMAIVTAGGWMRHSRTHRLETVLAPGAAPGEADRMESLLLSLDSALYTLFKRNRYFRE